MMLPILQIYTNALQKIHVLVVLQIHAQKVEFSTFFQIEFFLGYGGVICGICKHNYGSIFGKCQPCPGNNVVNIFFLFLTVIVIIILLGVYVKRQLRDDAKNTVTASTAKQFIHHLQLLATFGGKKLF
jgi:hypothetical protein